ncbi:MAG: histone deacetylase [Desulfomonile sp.]|nr:histone deacetylase [Desulfomonile sp.]
MEFTGIVRDPIYLRHDMGSYHPESPQRLEAIYGMIDRNASEFRLKEVPVRSASIDEIGSNHSRHYIQKIASTAGHDHMYLDPDTSTSADSWDAAIKAVGGLLNLVDEVVNGNVRNGFALVRPPGHHAEWDRAMGFCLFNNVAIAARHAIEKHGMKRIAIVDWDLHHGNGTQRSFYEDKRVLFISTHQYPHYPGSGAVRETGRGEGEGYTVNIPLAAGAGDTEYLAVFHTIVSPVLKSFKPELILVSAGFDAHERDPLGGMELSDSGYDQLLRVLMHRAAELCSERIVLTLEGGYNLQALRDSVRAVLRRLSNFDEAAEPSAPAIESLPPRVARVIQEVIATQRNYWPEALSG